METPLVSIWMPTYRRPQLLQKALASAIGQTYRNLQIIVRDNASGDETPEVVRSFADSRIEFFQATQNEGSARNGAECMRHVKGRYTLPLCDDDALDENYISILTGFLERDPTIMAAYGATHAINEEGNVISKRASKGTVKWHAGETIRAWCEGTLPLFSGINFLCRTSFILGLEGRHSFPDGHNSDNAIFMAAGIRGKVLFTDECVFYYRLHGLNSEQSHPCSLRAQGDREFLEFLDEEVNSEHNVGLPLADWRQLRAELQAMLARSYFGHLLKFRLHTGNVLEMLRNTMVYPIPSYGISNSLSQLRENKSSLLREVGKRALFSRL